MNEYDIQKSEIMSEFVFLQKVSDDYKEGLILEIKTEHNDDVMKVVYLSRMNVYVSREFKYLSTNYIKETVNKILA